MRAAILFHQKPSFLLLDSKRFGKKVTRDFDRRVMLAYQILQDETCPTCGIPVWIGHNEDNTIVFRVEDSNCFACGSLESEREDIRKRYEGRESSRFGVTEFVVAETDGGSDPYGVLLPGGPLPSRADAYDFMEKRREQLAAVKAEQDRLISERAAQKQEDIS